MNQNLTFRVMHLSGCLYVVPWKIITSTHVDKCVLSAVCSAVRWKVHEAFLTGRRALCGIVADSGAIYHSALVKFFIAGALLASVTLASHSNHLNSNQFEILYGMTTISKHNMYKRCWNYPAAQSWDTHEDVSAFDWSCNYSTSS